MLLEGFLAVFTLTMMGKELLHKYPVWLQKKNLQYLSLNQCLQDGRST